MGADTVTGIVASLVSSVDWSSKRVCCSDAAAEGVPAALARIVTGSARVFGLVHPGISHMGFSNYLVPGLPGVDCPGIGNDETGYAWDREGMYVSVARDLRSMGF